MVVVDDLKLGSPKTKEFLGLLVRAGGEGHRADRVAGADKNLALASRNVPERGADYERLAEHLRCAAQRQAGLHPGAFEQVEARLAKE